MKRLLWTLVLAGLSTGPALAQSNNPLGLLLGTFDPRSYQSQTNGAAQPYYGVRPSPGYPPAQDAYAGAPAQPSYAQPSYAQPSYAQPSYAQPSYAQPSDAQPSDARPTYGAPATTAAGQYGSPGYATSTTYARQGYVAPQPAPSYGAQPYGAQPYGTQPYGTQPYGTEANSAQPQPQPQPRVERREARRNSGIFSWLGGGTRQAREPAPQATPAALAPPANEEYLHRKIVPSSFNFEPGTLVIDTNARFLYLLMEDGQALRYGVGVGRQGFEWSGTATIDKKAEWPDWVPPKEMREREPWLPERMPGGEENPLGARALYLFEGNKDTLYRIHGTNQPETIGLALSSGCIRMLNDDVMDLYQRVPLGTKVVVL